MVDVIVLDNFCRERSIGIAVDVEQYAGKCGLAKYKCILTSWCTVGSWKVKRWGCYSLVSGERYIAE